MRKMILNWKNTRFSHQKSLQETALLSKRKHYRLMCYEGVKKRSTVLKVS